MNIELRMNLPMKKSYRIASTVIWIGRETEVSQTCGRMMTISARILPPLRAHLQSASHKSPLETVKALLTESSTQRALVFMVTLILPGFAIIPYLSPYFVSNAGRAESDLPYIYFFGGFATIISSRVIGKLADRYGKLLVFMFMALLSTVPILLVTNLPPVSLPVAIVVLTVFMVLMWRVRRSHDESFFRR